MSLSALGSWLELVDSVVRLLITLAILNFVWDTDKSVFVMKPALMMVYGQKE
jgi:hypothetical protein